MMKKARIITALPTSELTNCNDASAESSPSRHGRYAADQPHDIGGNAPQARVQGIPLSPANQCSGNDKAGLSRQKDCRDFHRTVWQQPTQQEFGLSCLHVVQPNDAQN